MDDKLLWDIIDVTRDELKIAQDGIDDLNEVVKDLQAEAIEQIKDNKELKADEMKYISEYNSLKAENKRIRNTLVDNAKMFDKLKADNKELYAEINDLKGENIDLINHADFIEQGKIKRVIDTFKSEIKELKADNKQQDKIPMEYKAEAEAYISHNPKVNKVYFFMVADDCISDDGYAQDWACNVDDAIAIINNE